MNEHDALLRAVRDAPEDDGPRLVYADWLQENGQLARGEFIRLQCDLETMAPGDRRRPAFEDRADDLLTEHETEWLGPLPPGLVEWTFRRGFVEEVVVREEPTLAGFAEWFARHPPAQVLPALVALCIRASRLRAALGYALQAQRLQPEDARLALLIASLQAALELPADALRNLDLATRLQPRRAADSSCRLRPRGHAVGGHGCGAAGLVGRRAHGARVGTRRRCLDDDAARLVPPR